jgi:hypothetical protein
MATVAVENPPLVDVDITSPPHKANPFELYARLRAESPVCRVPMPDGQTAFLVTRYDDVVDVLKDEPDGRPDRHPRAVGTLPATIIGRASDMARLATRAGAARHEVAAGRARVRYKVCRRVAAIVRGVEEEEDANGQPACRFSDTPGATPRTP